MKEKTSKKFIRLIRIAEIRQHQLSAFSFTGWASTEVMVAAWMTVKTACDDAGRAAFRHARAMNAQIARVDFDEYGMQNYLV